MGSSPDPPLPDEQAWSTPPPVEGDRIAGRVTDFDGLPLVGVRVEAAASAGADLDLLPTMTDGEGRFFLEGLATGRYDLRFVLGTVSARTLAVPAGTEDLVVKLARPQGILLVVKVPVGREPPAVVYVTLERGINGGSVRHYVGRHLTTRLLLWSLRPGRWRVTVWGGEYLPVVAEGIDVVQGRSAPEVEVLLSVVGGRILGRLTSPSGAAPTGALVGWRRLDPPGPWPRHLTSLVPAEDGTFTIRGLPAGRYLVSAGSPDGPVSDAEVTLEEAEEARVELTL